jgi:hypothetical protein
MWLQHLCRVFIVCVFLCTVCRLIVVLFCVMCVVSMLCPIVVPRPPGENPFAVKINIYLSNMYHTHFRRKATMIPHLLLIH